MSKRFTLGKSERLKSRKQIEQLFSEGKNFPASPFRVYYLFKKFVTHDARLTAQFGVGVSGKNFKRAVDRNRIKRLIREAYRLQKIELQESLKQKGLHLDLFVIYTGKEMPDFNTVKQKLNLILKKMEQITDENNSSNT